MLCEKIKNRNRVVQLTDGDWYETQSGAKFPIKSKPMIFSDLYQEFSDDFNRIAKLEDERAKAIREGKDFDLENYSKVINDYLQTFYSTVIQVTAFNGWQVDEDYIKTNMDYTDPYWYMTSVLNGKPIYDLPSLELKKKK